jgi:multiple sugar transport system substrate-binding protein
MNSHGSGSDDGAMKREPARLSRRAVIAAAPATLLAVAAGCGSSPSVKEASTNGKATLTYGLWDQTQVPAMKKIIAEFNKGNPKITVRIVLTPWDSYWTKLQTAATGGAAPDVFWMTQDSFKLYASGGVLLRLDDLIKRDHINMNDYVQSVVDGFTWKGGHFGLPKDTNSFGVFYNKKLFSEAGLRFPDSSWTWNDLVTVARRLTNEKKNVYGVAAPLTDVQGYYLTIPQANGYVISPDGRKSGYDDPRTRNGIEFWTDLINKYHASPSLQQMTDTDALTMFTSGKTAMYYAGSWDPVAINAVPYTKANADVAPLPKGLNNTFYANGLGNVVYAKTKYPTEAWKFTKFLGSKRAADIQAATGTVIPAYKGESAAYARSMPHFHMQNFIDQLPNGKTFPNSVDTAVWGDYALKEFASAWSGQMSVAATTKNVAAQMNTALAKEPK